MFDANYCYSLGYCAAALIDNGKTGYMAIVRNLAAPTKDWQPGGCPLASMMTVERRHGKDVPVIRKYYVELDKSPFTDFAEVKWVLFSVLQLIIHYYVFCSNLFLLGPRSVEAWRLILFSGSDPV